MMVDIAILKNWLLQNIPGVIVLGALGSIAGAIVIYAVRWSIKPIRERVVGFFYRAFVYRYYRPIKIAETIRATYLTHKPPETDGYLLFVLSGFLEAILALLLAISAIVFTIGMAVIYRLERPILLAISISISIILTSNCLKELIFVMTLMETAFRDLEKQTAKNVPKKLQSKK